jgi:hypothetical protein
MVQKFFLMQALDTKKGHSAAVFAISSLSDSLVCRPRTGFATFFIKTRKGCSFFFFFWFFFPKKLAKKLGYFWVYKVQKTPSNHWAMALMMPLENTDWVKAKTFLRSLLQMVKSTRRLYFLL